MCSSSNPEANPRLCSTTTAQIPITPNKLQIPPIDSPKPYKRIYKPRFTRKQDHPCELERYESEPTVFISLKQYPEWNQTLSKTKYPYHCFHSIPNTSIIQTPNNIPQSINEAENEKPKPNSIFEKTLLFYKSKLRRPLPFFN